MPRYSPPLAWWYLKKQRQRREAGPIPPPPFDPFIFFANGEQGGLYDPSDLTTLFQDAAGTIPVTSDGDPVGRINDKSGNGNHLTQAATSARPTYRTDGTRHWLEPDGVDDYLVAANYPAPLSQPITHAFAYRRLGTPQRPTLFDGSVSGGRNLLIIQPSQYEMYAGTGAGASISSTANTDYVGRVMFNGASSAASQNGSSPAVFNPGTQGLQGYRLFVHSANTLYFSGRYYGGLVINRALTPGEATKLDAWLAAKAGVAI